MNVAAREALDGLAGLLEEIAGIDPRLIRPDTSFAVDLDIDSLGLAEIAVAVEDRFGVRMPDDYARSMRTVGDAVDYITGLEGARDAL